MTSLALESTAIASTVERAIAGRWEFMVDIPGSFPSAIAFDTVNQRLVGIGEIQDGVVAFDLETREQVIVLEPVRGQATP